MPKYEALFLLYDRADEKYIYPGDVFEVTDPDKERKLLEKGLIKPASVLKHRQGKKPPQSRRHQRQKRSNKK